MKGKCHPLNDTFGWADGRRAALEFFRPQHGHHEVDEASERDERDDDGFHGRSGFVRRGSANFLAEVGIGRRESEERDCKGDKEEVVVHDALSIAPLGARA
jgi:hypothetical protein